MRIKLLSILLSICLVYLAGCGTKTAGPNDEPGSKDVAQVSTPADAVSRERAVRLVRSAVVAEIQIVDPFSIEIKEMQGGGEVLAVSYLSPLNSDDVKFDEELARVVFKAVPQFVRAEPFIPRLVVIATSAGDKPGSKGFAINYEDAVKWLNGKIDDQEFKESWIAAE
ncbi:MAG TPA: hypothetical protein PK040_03070 [Anaerolineaceae bacterium]|nr:hypothetical protein [Anaerolineaceae bacterium]